jgi:hypothetical protein
MQFEGAVVREQGVTFAVVAVKQHIVDDATQAESAIRSFAPLFPGVPIVLMGQSHSGRATFVGRRDIANFLSHVPVSRIP